MKKNNAAALQTGPRLFPEYQRPLTVILTVPIIFNVTFCNSGVSQTMVIPNNTGTVKGHSLKPVDFWIK